MSVVDTCLEQFRTEIAAVRQAPLVFSIAVIVTGGALGGGLYYLFNWQMWNVLEMNKIRISELTSEVDTLKLKIIQWKSASSLV